MYSYGPPHMAVQKQDDQHEHTFSSYVRIRDVVLKTCLGRWTIGRSGERGSGISVLPTRHDDDDDDDNYLKSPNEYGTRKPTGRPEKLSLQFKRRIVCEVKKKTSSTSKILKSLEDASCSTRTIRRYLNNEKIEHKKRLHRLREA